MHMQLIGFLGTSFVGMTIINRVLEGRFITSTDVSILNTMTIVRTVEIGGLFSIPVPNLEFFSGIMHLVRWDYSFFGGNAQIIQFFLYVFTFVAAFMLFLIVCGLLYNAFSRTR